MLSQQEKKEIEGRSLLAYPIARNAIGKDSNMLERVAYIKGATEERQRAKLLEYALDQIANMKRLPLEHSDTYAFNRNWHIATEALELYRKSLSSYKPIGI